jgi:hypothetical protein
MAVGDGGSNGNEEFATADIARVVRETGKASGSRRLANDPPSSCVDQVVEADHGAMVAAGSTRHR